MGEQKPEKTKKHICAGLLAHVKAGSARFFIPFFMNENNPAAGGRNGTQTKKLFSLEAGENSFFCK